MEELEMHPTVKPVALVADAILDVTRRGALVLDPFGGSGSGQKTGRTARLTRTTATSSSAASRPTPASAPSSQQQAPRSRMWPGPGRQRWGPPDAFSSCTSEAVSTRSCQCVDN